MIISEFLAELNRRDVQFHVNAGQVTVRAPKDALTATERVMLNQYKESIITLLQEYTTEPVSLYALSHGQKALWFVNLIAPESSAYNVMTAIRIRSELDISALRRAFQRVIYRHPCLRTTYIEIGGEPFQMVHEYMNVHFAATEASTWSPEELIASMAQTADLPFDLKRGPVLRINLFVRSAMEHILLLTVHHIAFDLRSLQILVDELCALYISEKNGEGSPLPPLAMQYSDYIRWCNELLESSKGEHLLSYWQEELAGELQVLNLPTDRPRPKVQTYSGATHGFMLSQDLTLQMKALSRTEGVTLYMVLLATFQILLHRYTAQDDILVGSPMAGRSRPEFERIIGYFVNPVVLRGDLSGDPTFKALLRRVHRTVLGALEHADYPFPLLVQRLQPTRDPSRSPLFQVAFVWDQPRQLEKHEASSLGRDEVMTQVDSSGLEMEFIEGGQRGAEFDLVLTIVEEPRSLSAFYRYNTDLFNAATVARMAGHFQTLLEGALANPESRLSDLPLLKNTERQQLLVEWNATKVDYPKDKCIHELFEAQAGRTPDAVAVVFEAKRLTYGELNRRANQVAHYLKSLGVGPETLVCICVERSPEMLVGLLGILKAGAGYVPLDPAYPKERLAFMLKDTHAPLLLTQERLAKKLPISGTKVVCLDGDIEIIAAQSEEDPMSGAAANNIAYVIYTSGSTGTPKGVMIEHESVVNLIRWHNRTYGVTPADKTTQLAGLSFDASVWEIWPYLTAGASVYIPDEETRVSPSRLVEWLAGQAITICFLPTPVAEAVLEEKLPRNLTLRTLLTGGDKLRRPPKKALPFSLVNNYGPTENTVVTTWTPVGTDTETDSAPAIGRPVDNTQCYVLDAHLQPVPIGVAGELHIGGVGLARGYLNRPELTAVKFIPNPFSEEPGARLYKTGDLVRYLPDGNLEFLGRIDHQVKIRGFRIELGEIETVLGQHPSVRDVVVLAREDSPGEKRLVAYLVVEEEPGPTTAELRSFLKEKLPDYMVPSAFVVLEAFPLTPNGKVDRKALPKPDVEKFTEKHYVAPETELERAITAIWQQVLKLEKVGVHDNFFDLGGHSLLMAQVLSKAREISGKDISMMALFQHPTIASLCTYLGGDQIEQPSFRQVYDRTKMQEEALMRKKVLRKVRGRS